MRKSLTYKILLSILGITSLHVFYNPVASAITYESYTLNGGGNPITITYNKIIIDNQMKELELPLSVYGNHLENGNANNNQVTINNSEISIVYSGWGINANSNKVTLNNGSYAGYVVGGYSDSDSEKGETNGNTVIINKSTVENVYGGYSLYGSADNNIVIIDNSVVDDYVSSAIGGYVPKGKSATGNTVKIIGKSNIENARIYGGLSDIGNIDIITGNTLTLDSWSGSTKSVKNFNGINFDNINWQNGETVLTITDGAKNDLANTEINLNSIAGGSKIAVGDTMTLIESSNNVDLGINKDNVKVSNSFFAGVTAQGTGTATINDDGSVDF